MDTLSDALASTADASPSTAQTSVRDRLKAMKDGAVATQSTRLPVSGVEVTYPGFISHEKVMAATKLAGKNRGRVGLILVAQVCSFEGDRLTVDDIGTLLHNRDTVHLINLLLGEDDAEADAEDGAGN